MGRRVLVSGLVCALVLLGEAVWAQKAPTPPEGSDAEIVAMLMQLNKNEIQAATTAEKKAVPDAVRNYAKMLREQHQKSLDATRQVAQKAKITPAETAAVAEMRDAGESKLASLSALDGEEFAKAYVDDMAKGHDDALRRIDQQLQTVKNAALRGHLERTRVTVATHLSKARELQNTMTARK